MNYPAKNFSEQEDSLGRRMCYRDGIHVPCPRENGAESEPVGAADEPESQEQQIADELGDYSIEDLKSALQKLGGQVSESRSRMTAQLASMIASGNVGDQPEQRPAPNEGKPNPKTEKNPAAGRRNTLQARIQNLVGKELSPLNVRRYRAALSALPLDKLQQLRNGAARIASEQPGDDSESHEYGCLMAVLPNDVASAIKRWAREYIDPNDLGEGGLEESPHITVKYGLQGSGPGMSKRVRDLVAGVRPFRIHLCGFAHFPGDDKEGSPLHIQVESEDLVELNLLVSSTFECVDTHPDYNPHATVAYVDPQCVVDYEDMEAPFLDIDCKIDTLEWSPAEGRKERIILSKTGYGQGAVGEKGIQKQGRRYRAAERDRGKLNAIRDRDHERHMKDPEYAAVHQEAESGDRMSRGVRDDFHEEHGGVRSEEVDKANRHRNQKWTRYRNEVRKHDVPNGERPLGHREETVRDITRKLPAGQSTREHRRTRHARQQYMSAQPFRPPQQKSLLDSPLLGRKSLYGYSCKSIPPSPFRPVQKVSRREVAPEPEVVEEQVPPPEPVQKAPTKAPVRPPAPEQGETANAAPAPAPAKAPPPEPQQQAPAPEPQGAPAPQPTPQEAPQAPVSQTSPKVSEILDPSQTTTSITHEELPAIQQALGGSGLTNIVLDERALKSLPPETMQKLLAEGLVEKSILPGMVRLTLKGMLVRNGGVVPPPTSQKSIKMIGDYYAAATKDEKAKFAAMYGITGIPEGRGSKDALASALRGRVALENNPEIPQLAASLQSDPQHAGISESLDAGVPLADALSLVVGEQPRFQGARDEKALYYRGRRDETETAIAASEDWLSRSVASPNGTRPNVVYTRREGADGASFNPKNGTLNVGRAAHPQAVIHEYGHALEHSHPEIAAACSAFLSHRFKDEPYQYLEDVDPLYAKTGILGRRDSFEVLLGPVGPGNSAALYIGRAYEEGTECLSMGLEMMYEDPRNFRDKDPEYFHFILGIMTGKVKGRPTPHE